MSPSAWWVVVACFEKQGQKGQLFVNVKWFDRGKCELAKKKNCSGSP
jgi:hypothetical protein